MLRKNHYSRTFSAVPIIYPFPRSDMPTFRTVVHLGSLGLVLASVAACSSKTKDGTATAGDSVAGGMAPATGATAANQPMSGMNGDSGTKGMQGSGSMAGMAMTGDADRDFLRMMSDHHKGMIAMAHMTKERSDVGGAAADAKKIDAAQDKELDRMVTMLENDFKDAYKAKVLPDNKAMADVMKGKKGTEYERAFYENTIQHHQAAIKMVDEYLPRGKSAAIKQMAEKIKADQTKEISEFKKKIGQLK